MNLAQLSMVSKEPPEKKPHQVRKPVLDALQIQKHGNKTKYTYIYI